MSTEHFSIAAAPASLVVTLVLHAFDKTTRSTKGYYRVTTSVLVTLRFDDVEAPARQTWDALLEYRKSGCHQPAGAVSRARSAG